MLLHLVIRVTDPGQCQPPAEPEHRPLARRTDGAGAPWSLGPLAARSSRLSLHTHLGWARTQITLIHFKPTLSPEALQQILLKPYLHNVGRHIAGLGTPGASAAISETQDSSLVNLSH